MTLTNACSVLMKGAGQNCEGAARKRGKRWRLFSCWECRYLTGWESVAACGTGTGCRSKGCVWLAGLGAARHSVDTDLSVSLVCEEQPLLVGVKTLWKEGIKSKRRQRTGNKCALF